MKKELLMASALVSTLGAASVAEAVTATMGGSLKIGQEFESQNLVQILIIIKAYQTFQFL